ncbi:ferritin-like domain-containing protein [Saccharothrix sp. ST-888]|uniref:ferritin-like domain-containing protein n=1 Tax=Saccharothrix sp. ST-888 TaxID=1427391 RepID=UPI0018CF4251|nr:ferritin-like protein [Saccharothrix sp. ST-888]
MAEATALFTRRPSPLPEEESHMSVTTVPGVTIASLLQEPEGSCTKDWLRTSLQVAVQLEFATIPPYLYAYWSVVDPAAELADALLGIAWQEMLHMGLACNMLTAAGGKPKIKGEAAPKYPGGLPGDVRRGLVIPLQGVSTVVKDPEDALKTFVDIEQPEKTVLMAIDGPTIGQFYARIAKELPGIAAREGFGGRRQLTGRIGGDKLEPIHTVDDALKAIKLICEQGEGTSQSPSGGVDPAELAHFYRFAEHWEGRRLERRKPPHEDKWAFTGEEIKRPALHLLAKVPKGGWTGVGGDLGDALAKCNTEYRQVLADLESGWDGPDGVADVNPYVGAMFGLNAAVKHLIGIQSEPTCGPDFRA